jgi:BirA family biotin operon repressor/biotin-[acetyl-CoA-carboxylase] ligase
MIIGSKIKFSKNLPSTNTHLIHLLKKTDLPEGTIITTDYQSAGRGQPGNKWESEDGKNLLFSILLFPYMIRPAEQFLISMTLSLGICDFINRYIPDSSIKWPNDIYVNNDKIAGLLIENSIMEDQIEYSVAGIGLNVNQETFMSDAPNPVSLKLITGLSYNLISCLKLLAADLDKKYKQLISGDYSRIRSEYTARLFLLNRWSNFRDSEGVFDGRIVSVTENGRLQVEKRSGVLKEYSFKEVEFIL